MIDRLLARVVAGPNCCWIWTGAKNKGYGIIGDTEGRRTRSAHRVSYEHFVGAIPDGLTLDHLCRNPACVNPDHLEAVTSGENVKRSPIAVPAVNARKTHCKRGHEFTPENTYLHNNQRMCKECRREICKRTGQARRDRFRAMGLNSDGTPRRRVGEPYRVHR